MLYTSFLSSMSSITSFFKCLLAGQDALSVLDEGTDETLGGSSGKDLNQSTATKSGLPINKQRRKM